VSQLVNVVSQGDRTLRLCGALLMYDSGQGDVYATTHPIELDASNPDRRVIGVGSALTKEALAKFAESVSIATAYAGFVPSNMLYTSPNLLAWWVPAAVRNTWFKCSADTLGEVSGPAAHPAMVFIASSSDWYVFALRASDRPDPETTLYESPHMNVWAGGRICTGNVELPEHLSAETLTAYEEAFFRSRFTHPNRQDAVKAKGGMYGLWRAQLAKPDPAAMTRALKPAKETLKQAIERISNKTTN
jgi:PRTRC genetic system protein B